MPHDVRVTSIEHDPSTDPRGDETSRLPRWVVVTFAMAGAISAGALAAVLVTAVSGRWAEQSPSSTQVAVASHTDTPRPEPTPEPRPSPTPVPSVSASASPSPTEAPSDPADGCFAQGVSGPEGDGAELLVAESLLAKLPEVMDGAVVERWAYVGSSVQSGLLGAYVRGFAQCTRADPSAIRFGFARGASSLGHDLMAIEVDGFSGEELADMFITGTSGPQLLAALQEEAQAGWTYQTDSESFIVTAGPQTAYWIKWFCCVDPFGAEDLPTFDEIVLSYLDNINDEPAP